MKWNNKYIYPKYSRSNEDGLRKYLFGDQKLPSVTAILSATKSEEDRASLELWKKRVGNKEANRIAVRSKSHAAPEEEEVLASYDVTDTVSTGSSLKFCLVAEGKADIYYRHGPTMEWDTAAGQAVLEAAGGVVLNPDKSPFRYNKENLLNGSFLCLGF